VPAGWKGAIRAGSPERRGKEPWPRPRQVTVPGLSGLIYSSAGPLTHNGRQAEPVI
jgi:hypothetical protein